MSVTEWCFTFNNRWSLASDLLFAVEQRRACDLPLNSKRRKAYTPTGQKVYCADLVVVAAPQPAVGDVGPDLVIRIRLRLLLLLAP